MENFGPVSKLPIALDAYHHTTLHRILGALGVRITDERIRKHEMIDKLTRLLGSPQHIEAAERHLTPLHWQALGLNRLSQEPVALYTLFLRLQATGVGDSEALGVLDRLLGLGCLIHYPQSYGPRLDMRNFNLDDYSLLGHRVFTFPSLVERALQSTATPAPAGRPATPARVKQGTFSELQKDIYLVLQAAAGGELRLKVDGAPYKADAAKLVALLGGESANVSPNVVAKKSYGKGKAPEPSPKFWFTLAMLKASNLTVEELGYLRTTPATKPFLGAPALEQARALYAAWLDCVFSEFRRITTLSSGYYYDQHRFWVEDNPDRIGDGDQPALGRLVAARRAIDRMLRRVAGTAGEWIDIRFLAEAIWADDPEFLVPLVKDGYYGNYWYSGYYGKQFNAHELPRRTYSGIQRAGVDYKQGQLTVGKDWPEVEGAYVAQVVVEPLYWLGLVDLGLDASDRAVSFRLALLGRQALLGEYPDAEPVARSDGPSLVVQPNFELVVLDAGHNFGLLSRLDEFAERQSLDRAAIFRLTRDSLVRGLSNGLTGQSILDLLEDSARRPLPQNVRFSIEEWVRLYERVHLRRSAVLLEADSPQQMESWLADASLSPLIGKRLSATTALIAAGQQASVVNLLKQRAERPTGIDYARPPKRLLRLEAPVYVHVPAKQHEPYTRYRLGQFAERLPDDGAEELHYRITPESIFGGVKSGLTPHDIWQYIADMAVPPVPAELRVRVRGWAGAYKPIRYEPVVAVEMSPGFQWSELDDVPEIAGLILRRIGPTLALVASDKFEGLRAALAERGIGLEAGLPDLKQAPPPRPAPPPPSRPAAPPARKRSLETLAEMLGLGDGDPDDIDDAVVPVFEPKVASIPSDTRTVTVTQLAHDELLVFFEKAIRQGRLIFVGAQSPKGETAAFKLRPTGITNTGEHLSIEAVDPDGANPLVIPFRSILGVANVLQEG